MKKVILIILCFVMVFLLSGCGFNISDVTETERKETEETIQIEQTEQTEQIKPTEQTEQPEQGEQTEQPVAEPQNVQEEENTETPEKINSVAQTEFCWKVKPINGDDWEAELSAEESKMVYDIIASCKYDLGTADCMNDFAFVRDDGSVIYYHSDCGTFNNTAENLSYRTLDEQRMKVNDLIVKLGMYSEELCGLPLAPEGFEKP